MTLRQLEVFLAVASARSFRGAAEQLHLSQPALSQHVRELEAELGSRLFDRLARSVQLTEAGRILQEHAARVFTTLSDAHRAIGELQGLQRGALTVGASSTPGIYVLPPIIAAFRRRYPGVELTLRLGNSEHVERLVRQSEVDLGVVGGHGLAPGEECLAAGLEDELVLVAAADHPWAAGRALAPERLTGVTLLLREVGSATRQLTERALRAAGIDYRVGMVFEHTEAIKQAVMAGLGVAFVSVHAVRGEVTTGRLRVIRLRGLRLVRHFHLIHNEARTLGAGAHAFTALLRSADCAPRGGRPGAASSVPTPAAPCAGDAAPAGPTRRAGARRRGA